MHFKSVIPNNFTRRSQGGATKSMMVLPSAMKFVKRKISPRKKDATGKMNVTVALKHNTYNASGVSRTDKFMTV